ncbi:MAG: 2-amino-4-hydroxy-6-hydroxymethyldihydropteridine diphosphokinase [Planctomycetaceae bacterium]|nr:2-amino-4-hydroxy-6-hydroxymethyldihydropteridine diphosphokinase [Planctomycetaceae bacterium]MCB9951117.1 2-amino-4-hydroxy-6-hydroxymethyldihydropteridine diphosphokinase [Planctomycetaceae bacterium]
MVESIIALGGNIGDVRQTFSTAIERLDGAPGTRVVRRSSLYDTTPVGSAAGERYLNAAVCIETEFQPDRLLFVLQAIEESLGRHRTYHWAPRTLDLDLISYGERHVLERNLIVPHPAMWYRRFVLNPVYEIAPDCYHPLLNLTCRDLLFDLHRRPVEIFLNCPADLASTIKSHIGWRFSGNSVAISYKTSDAFIIFSTDISNNPRSVLLPEQQPEQFVVQVLTGILDEPQIVGYL